MPIYEYECEACRYHFEELQPFNGDTVMTCPECGARANRLISAGAGLIFKGSGFYITDYARKKAPEASEEKKETASKEKKDAVGAQPKTPEKTAASKKE